MRVNCPNCASNVEIPNAEAGKSVDCPDCGRPFEAPVLWDEPELAPRPEPEPPPPPPEPDEDPEAMSPYDLQSPPPVEDPPTDPQPAPPAVPQPQPAPRAPAPAAAIPAAVPGERTLTLKLDVVQWIAPACFLVLLPLTLFTWVGAYPAGYPAYTQNLWQAIFADFSVGAVGDTDFKGYETEIDEQISTSALFGLPYLLFLAAAAAVALAGPLLPRLMRPLPAWAVEYMPYRTIALAALAGLSLLLLLCLLGVGLSLENAVVDVVELNFGGPPPETQSAYQTMAIKIDSELGRYRLGSTFWLRTVVLLHFIAMAAVGLELWLRRRGNLPAPTISLRW